MPGTQRPNRGMFLPVSVGILLLIGLVGFVLLTQQPHMQNQTPSVLRQPEVSGNSERGRQLISDYGCGSCHTIPGVVRANAHVGPPLTAWSQRHYIAGNLSNTFDNLTAWIMDPQAIEPGTAMPMLGVSEEEARDMSAYLFLLGR